MEEANFDQRRQSADNQQNAARDINNYSLTLLDPTRLSKEVSRDVVVQLIAKLKSPLQQSEAEDAASPPILNCPQSAAPAMQPFQPQQVASSESQVAFRELKDLAAQNGNPWLPARTQGLNGVDLTGLWLSLADPVTEIHVRQFGPYINIAVRRGLQVIGFGEGVINPTTWFMRIVGANAWGVRSEIQAQLYTDWSLQGVEYALNPWGVVLQANPFHIRKVV